MPIGDSPPNVHELKTWPEPFKAVWDSRKTASFRRDDRDFAAWDRLRLKEYDPGRGVYSGREIVAVVTDVRLAGPFGIPEGYAMLSFKVLTWRDPR